MSPYKLQLKNLSKQYSDQQTVLKDFNLDILPGEFVVLVGPSGCGKSTTLRMIAGLEELSQGEVLIDGRKVNKLKPQERNLAMVFQNYALYPHLSIYHNLAFNLKIKKLPKEEIDSRVKKIAQLLNLSDLLKRKPKSLSGGQQQRVALGRAIIKESKLFLMDEPLSNLDAKLRTQMRIEIKKIHDEIGATSIYVTHDQTEAMTMADKLVVMNEGLIQQVGKPRDIYQKPSNKFVASFIGSPPMNFLTGTLRGDLLEFDDYFLKLSKHDQEKLGNVYDDGEKVILGIRPEDILIVQQEAINTAKSRRSTLNLAVENIELIGSKQLVYLKFGADILILEVDAREEIKLGQFINVYFKNDQIHFFDFESEIRI